MNFRDALQLQDTSSDLKRKNRLEVNSELLLDNLDEETVLDISDTPQEGFRNVYDLRKYNQSKANAESIRQNAK